MAIYTLELEAKPNRFQFLTDTIQMESIWKEWLDYYI